MNTKNICIVLVEPQGPRNIGAVCRIMKNFGIFNLRLVKPQTDHLAEESRHMAVKSTDILENAGIYPSLHDAVSDCSLTLGTTRRHGKYRDDIIYPDQAASKVVPYTIHGRTALVFGREDNGLKTSELDLCQLFITIPTSDTLPSMNLSHAVSIVLYEIWKNSVNNLPGEKVKENATSHEVETMIAHMKTTLVDIDYLNHQNPDHILRAYKRIFGRAGLSKRDVDILQGLWSKIDYLHNLIPKR